MLKPRKCDLNPVQNSENEKYIPTQSIENPENGSQLSLSDTIESPQLSLSDTTYKTHKEKTQKYKAQKRGTLSKTSFVDEKIPKEKAQEAVDKVRTRTKQIRTRTRTRKVNTGSTSGWETVWQDEFEACYPAQIIPKWGGREFGIMKNLHKRLNENLEKNGRTFEDFLRFAVSNWTHVLQTNGTGVRDYQAERDARAYSQMPKRPSVRYLSPCISQFSAAFSRRVSGGAELSPHENEIGQVMKFKHLTYSEAAKVVAKREVSREDAGKVSRGMNNLRLQKKEFEIKKRVQLAMSSSSENKRLDRYGRVKPEFRMKEDLEPLVIVDLPDWEDLPDSGRPARS